MQRAADPSARQLLQVALQRDEACSGRLQCPTNGSERMACVEDDGEGAAPMLKQGRVSELAGGVTVSIGCLRVPACSDGKKSGSRESQGVARFTRYEKVLD